MAIIRTESLTKRFGQVTALEDVTLELEPGIIGLVGSNGAGKSTLIRTLLGLLPPTGGRAFVMDHDVAREGTAVRALVGYMPEHDALPPDLPATEFVTHMAELSGLPRSAARERTADVLRHVGLYEERYRPIGGYSTGMRQRVMLAQALVHDPRLLLLDEPTNGLDPAGRDDMLALVRRTGTEFSIAIVLASHLLGEIERVCDFLVAIEGGRLVRAAPVASFTGHTGLVRVELDEPAAVFGARLVDAGLHCRVDGRNVFVELADDAGYDVIRDAAAELAVGLVRVEQERRTLEDLFRDDAATGAPA
jgi:ABC-2 type transport system ATP-binding protein